MRSSDSSRQSRTYLGGFSSSNRIPSYDNLSPLSSFGPGEGAQTAAGWPPGSPFPSPNIFSSPNPSQFPSLADHQLGSGSGLSNLWANPPSPQQITPPRSPAFGQQSGYGFAQQPLQHSPGQGFGRMSGGLFSPGGGSRIPSQVYDMKSLTLAVSMVQAGTGDIRRIFQSATFKPRLPGLTKLVSQLTREGHWAKGLEVFDALDCIGLRPDTTITNAAISACDKGGQWEKALQIFHAMEQWGLPRDAITYSAVISALSKGRQWSLAIEVFNHMCDSGIDCDAVTCCSLITALDKGGQWQLAEEVFIQMYADHPQFKMLLQCMNEDVVQPSVCTAPASPGQPLQTTKSLSADTLAALSAAASAAKPHAELADAAAGGLGLTLMDPALGGLSAPSTPRASDMGPSSTASLGSGSTPGGSTPGGLQQSTSAFPSPAPKPEDLATTPTRSPWNRLPLGGLDDSLMMGQNALSTLLGPSAPASPLDLPPSLWSDLGLANMTPAEQHQLMELAGQAGMLSPSQLQRTSSAPPSRSLLRTSSLNTKKAAPNRVCCNALLAAYARASPPQWQRAIRLLDLMWQCGGELCPDIVSYNTVIKACGNAMQIDLGFKVYQLMRKRGIEPTVATFGTLICIASDAQQSARVKEAWGWLQASGLEVHVTCVNAYLGALIKDGDWLEAQALFRSLLRPGMPGTARPNAVTFNLMMSAYLARGQPQRVQELFEEACALGITPSLNTYTNLVAAYNAQGRWEEALGTVALMCRSDSTVRPAIGIFTSMFQSLMEAAHAGGPGHKLVLARHMQTLRSILKSHSHLYPDLPTYRTMIHAFHAVGDSDNVLDVFNSMVAHNLAVDGETAAAVLDAVCTHKGWDKCVQLLKVLCEQGPKLDVDVLKNTMLAVARDNAWIHLYCILKVCSSSGQLEELVGKLQSEGHTEVLFMALLVVKETIGAWREALDMFNWMQQVQPSEFSRSPEVYRIMFELLVIHGGAAGLAAAVSLCKDAHEKGFLRSYTPLYFPEASSGDGGASPSALETPHKLASAVNKGSAATNYTVKLEGYSRIETIVTLISWINMVAEADKQGVRVLCPVVDIVLQCAGDCLDSSHVRPAVALVLEGRVGELLGVDRAHAPAEVRELLPLSRPLVYFSAPDNPALIHVQTTSIYQSLSHPLVSAEEKAAAH